MYMKRIGYYLIVPLIALLVEYADAQTKHPRELREMYAQPDEIVSFSGSTSMQHALDMLNDFSKKFLEKIIVDPKSRTHPIQVDINQMHWMNALETILRNNQLWYDEYADYLKIISLRDEERKKESEGESALEHFKSREVMISAIFFEADWTKLHEVGTSWDLFRGNDVNLGIAQKAGDGKRGLLELDINPDLDYGSLVAIFKTLENEQIGEVIANPQITVESGEQGGIQVGSDVSVTVQDFAGNTVNKFFSTGSIIRVTPEIISHDSINFIHLNLEIERSNSINSSVGLEIKKSSAETSVYLLDGEETIIGGLYINEETHTREGVPLLKDLPWWFFGMRYLFGYESKKLVKKELLILIKAELLPTLEARFRQQLQSNPHTLQKSRQRFNNRLENFKKQARDD